MPASKRIVAVVSDPELYEKVEQLFGRASFAIHRVQSGAGALVLLGNRDFDLVVIGAPLPDLGLDRFLRGLRALDSQGRGSPLLVLVPDRDVATVAPVVRGERIEALPVSAGWAGVQSAVSRVLGVAARTSRRILVEVKAAIGAGPRSQLLQTVNLSSSGMLVRGTVAPELGEVVGVALTLPGDEAPLELIGPVVRHAEPEREGVEGFAIHFGEIPERDRERLARFVEADLGGAPGDRGTRVAS